MNLFDTKWADRFAVWLPAASAAMSIASGALAFRACDHWAAVVGMVAGIAASGGIFATYRASKIRDDLMRFQFIDAATTQAQSYT